MRYDAIYDAMAERAVDSAAVDIKAFMKKMMASGVSVDRVEQLMLEDLETGGPLFGKFFRSLGSAATSSVKAAYSQGVSASTLIEIDKEIADAVAEFDLEDRLEEGDPEAFEQIEEMGGKIPHQWIAELRHTCYKCLPLHGKVTTLDDWRDKGLHPDTIHDGWNEPCHCQLLPLDWMRDEDKGIYGSVRKEVGPLVRNKDIEGVRGGKKTVRGITDADIARAQEAVAKAMQSDEGQKILAILGSSGGE